MGHMCKDALCWSCKNAVPKIVGGKYVHGCSWSVQLEPVEGWKSTHSIKNKNSNCRVETWHVNECPLYCSGKEKSGESEALCDDGGYIRIAEIVLRQQINAYKAALENYARSGEEKHLCKVEPIERELRTPYYAALTLGKIDMDRFIAQCRAQHGLKPEVQQ